MVLHGLAQVMTETDEMDDGQVIVLAYTPGIALIQFLLQGFTYLYLTTAPHRGIRDGAL